jgi:ferredoxin
MHTVRLHPLEKQINVQYGTSLIDVLREFGVEFPCGGKGTCGKCKVKLLNGEIQTTQSHRQKLNQLDLSEEWRLACYSSCTSGITLEIEQFNHLILAFRIFMWIR